jgi:hypothetical protein
LPLGNRRLPERGLPPPRAMLMRTRPVSAPASCGVVGPKQAARMHAPSWRIKQR